MSIIQCMFQVEAPIYLLDYLSISIYCLFRHITKYIYDAHTYHNFPCNLQEKSCLMWLYIISYISWELQKTIWIVYVYHQFCISHVINQLVIFLGEKNAFVASWTLKKRKLGKSYYNRNSVSMTTRQLTSKTVHCISSEKESRCASFVWQSVTSKAIKSPIPSPLWADVGTKDI